MAPALPNRNSSDSFCNFASPSSSSSSSSSSASPCSAPSSTCSSTSRLAPGRGRWSRGTSVALCGVLALEACLLPQQAWAMKEVLSVSADGSIEFQDENGEFTGFTNIPDVDSEEQDPSLVVEGTPAVGKIDHFIESRTKEETRWNTRVKTVCIFGVLLGVLKCWSRVQAEGKFSEEASPSDKNHGENGTVVCKDDNPSGASGPEAAPSRIGTEASDVGPLEH